MALRVCRNCRREALTVEDLNLFAKKKDGKYGYRNLCKSCDNARTKQWCANNPEKRREVTRKWNQDNKEMKRKHYHDNIKKHRESRRRRIGFRGKRIQLQENPRTGICVHCGKTEEVQRRQHSIHHIIYDDSNPLDHTLELCNRCHRTLHYQINLNPNPNPKYSYPYPPI